VKIIHKKEAWRRSYSLNIDKNGYLVVRTNKLCTQTQLDRILQRHRRWITKRLREFEKLRQVLEIRHKELFDYGSKLMLLGETFFVYYRKTDKKRISVLLEDGRLYVESENKLQPEPLKQVVEKYLKSLAKEVFIEKCDFYAEKYGFKYKKLFVKSQKSKWGSCSSERNLNFNWKLLLAPEEILDYVVIHEVCHLKQLNHSSKFWDLVDIECPNHKEIRAWLRENGGTILNQFT
jgi:predicted metal-dependent hydrolase